MIILPNSPKFDPAKVLCYVVYYGSTIYIMAGMIITIYDHYYGGTIYV